MQLTEHRLDDQYFIHSISGDAIRIVDAEFSESIFLTPTRAPQRWPVPDVASLEVSHLEALFEAEPDVVILATGRTQRFPSHDIQREFLRRSVGLEVMTLEAAARTFNVLASEERRVLGALIWESANSR